MLSQVRKLEVARDFFARAPAWGLLTEVASRHHVSRRAAYRVIGRMDDALGRGGPVQRIRQLESDLERARRDLQVAYKEIDQYKRQLEPDWGKIHRFIVKAAVSPPTLRSIAEQVLSTFEVPVSHEYVRGVVNQAGKRAREVHESLAPQRLARRAVGDEIYVGDRPMLVVAEPDSLAVLSLSVEPTLSLEAWNRVLSGLPDDLEVIASDLGRVLLAAIQGRGWPHQADLFHAEQTFRRSLASEERRAYRAIEDEYACESKLALLCNEDRECDELCERYEVLRRTSAQIVERFDRIECEARRLSDAVRICDELGRWIPVEVRVERIEAALRKLRELGLPHHRRVANYWRNPNLLTFARQIEERLGAVVWPEGPLSPEIRDAAIGAWALQRRLVWGAGAKIAALRVLMAQRACGEFGALRIAVAAILDRALRASSAIECLNSRWRVYQQVKKTFSTDYAYLVALQHNMTPFSEGPRKGRSPFEILGIDSTRRDWLSLVV